MTIMARPDRIARIALIALIALIAVAALPRAIAAQSTADQAWEAGNLDRARELYAERLAADSSDLRALNRMALLLGWDQRYDESIALFDRLLRLAPENLDAAVARARVMAWKGDLDDAIDALQTLLDRAPDYRPALEAVATFRSWAGDYDRALELFDRVAALDPSDRAVHYQRARVLGWADRYADARAVYDSLLVSDPHDIQALLGLAQILAWSDRLDSARVVYRRVLAEDDGNMEAMTGLARTSSYAGDLVEAERRWRALVDADPDNVDALVGLGRTLQWQGRNAAARPYLDRAIRAEPGVSEARELLRWVHAALGPRVAPAFAYEWDSDGNEIITVSGHAAWHPVSRLELRVDGYTRSATYSTIVADPRGSNGGTFTASVQLPPGWTVAGSIGLGAPDTTGVGSAADTIDLGGIPTWSVLLSAPSRWQVRTTLTAGRELLDATAVLMARRVVYDQARLNFGTRLGRWTLEGAASAAWFESRVSGNGNRRLAGNLAATRPVTPWLDMGGSVRVFGFDADLNEGYFDPNLYLLLEAPASASTRLGPLDASLALVPGAQQITVDGEIKPAFRTTGALSWQRRPGQTIGLSAFYAANGASPFAQQAADYRYFALNLRVRWVF